MTNLKLTPLNCLQVSKHMIPRYDRLPNTSIQHYPLLIYKQCFDSEADASTVENHLKRVGVVNPEWRYSMYPTTHFHSNTHEVLCVVNGRALLCFGGEQNPQKIEEECKSGDVVIIPAGVGHKLVQDYDGSFQMVGSYPKGANHWDMCYGREGEEKQVNSIEKLGWFDKDPVYGDTGPSIDVASGRQE